MKSRNIDKEVTLIHQNKNSPILEQNQISIE